jgi:hypothetical protein
MKTTKHIEHMSFEVWRGIVAMKHKGGMKHEGTHE